MIGDVKMIGVYKITNNINGKAYVGCSVDINRRFNQHKNYEKSTNEPNKILYHAFKKYNIENFTFEVLEECNKEQLVEREIYYIEKFNTYKNGYNGSIGGDIGAFDRDGEKHPNAKLTKNDVIDIRTRYQNLERKAEVYLLYQDRISRTGFNKIWQGVTWKNVMSEVYTQENKNYHAIHTANIGSVNGRSKLNEEDVKAIRLRKKNGEDRRSVYKDYKDLLTFGSFDCVWYNQNWKHITV